MISYYFFLMIIFIYLHKYVYYWGEKILIKYNNITLSGMKNIKISELKNITISELKNITISELKNENNLLNLTEYKIKYIIKNIWKSYILFLMLILSTFHFLEGFLNNRWYNVFFYIFGTIYSSLDISGLIFVRGLPTATVIHHCVVGFLGITNLLVDYEVSGYYRSIIIYTYFSIIPFLVNFYLGYRYISNNKERIKKIAKYSYKIYTFSLITNILCQIIFFINQEYSHYLFVYIGLYTLILYDDIKLIKFLRKESL